MLGVPFDDAHDALDALEQLAPPRAADRRDEPALAHRGDVRADVVGGGQLQQRARVDLELERVQQLLDEPGEMCRAATAPP